MGFGFRVSDFRFGFCLTEAASDERHLVFGAGVGAEWCETIDGDDCVLGFGFRVSGFGFRFSGFGLCVVLSVECSVFRV